MLLLTGLERAGRSRARAVSSNALPWMLAGAMVLASGAARAQDPPVAPGPAPSSAPPPAAAPPSAPLPAAAPPSAPPPGAVPPVPSAGAPYPAPPTAPYVYRDPGDSGYSSPPPPLPFSRSEIPPEED